jgi:hypothetical protein
MHESLLAQAALAANPRIYGVELRDYSLGHELYLIREGSPFISPAGSTVLPEDVFKAVWVCSSSWSELRNGQRSYSHPLKLWLLARNAKKDNKDTANHARNVRVFQEYRESGGLFLPMSDNRRPGRQECREPGAPYILRLQQFLMTKLRLSEAEAWDYQFGLAVMRWQTFWEQEGGLDVFNAYDEACDPVKAEAEIEERIRKQKEEKCQA